MRRRRPDSAPRRGFTMLELMVVIVILGVFVGMSIPTMRGVYRKSRLAAAARQFAQVARYARAQAVLQSRVVDLRVDPEGGRYRVDLDPFGQNDFRGSGRRDRMRLPEVHYLDAERGRIRFDSVETALDPDDAEDVKILRFYRSGSASAATVVLVSEEDRRMTLTISAATGAVAAHAGGAEALDASAEGEED